MINYPKKKLKQKPNREIRNLFTYRHARMGFKLDKRKEERHRKREMGKKRRHNTDKLTIT